MPTPFVKKIFAGTIDLVLSFHFFKYMGTPEERKKGGIQPKNAISR
jgi:hypothetical protein